MSELSDANLPELQVNRVVVNQYLGLDLNGSLEGHGSLDNQAEDEELLERIELGTHRPKESPFFSGATILDVFRPEATLLASHDCGVSQQRVASAAVVSFSRCLQY